jgi:hypothetical protein
MKCPSELFKDIPTATLVEIGHYMTAQLWVVDYAPRLGVWTMMKEPYLDSEGPFEVIAVGWSFLEVFEKAKAKQRGHSDNGSTAGLHPASEGSTPSVSNFRSN